MTPEQIAVGWKEYGKEHPDYPNIPTDWDHGPYLCRDGGIYHMRGYGWAHGLGCWKAEAERAAPNVAKKRTLEGFADESPDTRYKWLHLAKAAIAAMKDTQP